MSCRREIPPAQLIDDLDLQGRIVHVGTVELSAQPEEVLARS